MLHKLPNLNKLLYGVNHVYNHKKEIVDIGLWKCLFFILNINLLSSMHLDLCC